MEMSPECKYHSLRTTVIDGTQNLELLHWLF